MLHDALSFDKVIPWWGMSIISKENSKFKVESVYDDGNWSWNHQLILQNEQEFSLSLMDKYEQNWKKK